MPKILDEAVRKIRAKGASKSSAYAIATAALQKAGDLKKGSNVATAKGKRRGAMSEAERARTRKAT
jgi:hypothetical protein